MCTLSLHWVSSEAELSWIFCLDIITQLYGFFTEPVMMHCSFIKMRDNFYINWYAALMHSALRSGISCFKLMKTFIHHIASLLGKVNTSHYSGVRVFSSFMFSAFLFICLKGTFLCYFRNVTLAFFHIRLCFCLLLLN